MFQIPRTARNLISSSFLAFFLLATPAWAQFAGVLTMHNDNARTGQNLNETFLNPARVSNTARFGKIGSYAVQGQVYAQPLYVPKGTLGLTKNLLYIATEQDMVYAFDADNPGSAPVWTDNLVPPNRSWKQCDVENCTVCPDVGITGTPVIDPVSGTMYLVTRTGNYNNNPPTLFQTIHELDIATGTDKFHADIPADANFSPSKEGQRVGLLLSNGILYVAWWSEGQGGHGVLKGFDVTTLKQTAQFVSNPNPGTLPGQAGIWMSGAGLAADASGFVYLETADGVYDGLSNWGDTVLKLDCSTANCSVADYFTPHTQSVLYQDDIDVGSSGLMLLPPQCTSGCAHPNMVIGGGKDGNVYVIDRDNFGGYNQNTNQNVQTVKGKTLNALYGSPAYWTDSSGTQHVYEGPCNGALKMYNLNSSTGLLSAGPASPSTYAFPGPTPSVSANGAVNGIVWAIERTDTGANSCSPTMNGVLHAYDATNVATELYNSTKCPTRDVMAPATKFLAPTIANGKVYVATSGGEVDVYGAFSSVQACQ
jgi:hypothetical protein